MEHGKHMAMKFMPSPKGMMARKKMKAVMGEFKRGTLHSGSGGMVKGWPQAVAIALSEARKRSGKGDA